MEQIINVVDPLVLAPIFLWLILRFFFGLFCSPVSSRWFAHTSSIAYLCMWVISSITISIGFIGTSVRPFAFFISLNFIVIPLSYRWDKKQSNCEGAERIPEVVLHSLAIFGGGIGTLLSQHLFRHKTKKESFQRLRWIAIGTSVALYYIVLFKV